MIIAFFGHRDTIIKDELADKLDIVVRGLIQQGANEFLLGGYGTFDKLAARTVKNLKEEYPYIRSTFVMAYLDQDYNSDLYDDSVYPPLESVPKRFAISKRNEWIVERADIIIYYVERGWGGAASAIKKAKRKGKTMISLTNHISRREAERNCTFDKNKFFGRLSIADPANHRHLSNIAGGFLYCAFLCTAQKRWLLLFQQR